MSPIILRYTLRATGATFYWNWDRIDRFVQDTPGQSVLILKSGTVIRLDDEEARQVAEQLDALIDPPVFTLPPDTGATHSALGEPLLSDDAWAKRYVRIVTGE